MKALTWNGATVFLGNGGGGWGAVVFVFVVFLLVAAAMPAPPGRVGAWRKSESLSGFLLFCLSGPPSSSSSPRPLLASPPPSFLTAATAAPDPSFRAAAEAAAPSDACSHSSSGLDDILLCDGWWILVAPLLLPVARSRTSTAPAVWLRRLVAAGSGFAPRWWPAVGGRRVVRSSVAHMMHLVLSHFCWILRQTRHVAFSQLRPSHDNVGVVAGEAAEK